MFKPGMAAGGNPASSRPSSRANNRSTDDGGVSSRLVQRTDSTRSMLDSNESKVAKNNIKVAVRMRPLSEKERSRGDNAVWATDGSGGVGLMSARIPGQLNIKYAYDQVFDMTATNEQVFEQVGRPTIEPVVLGISGTVFAYGVTSSGKTHTMMGTAADPGVVPRAITALFGLIGQQMDRAFTVTFSMMEIYCEMLNDLLDPTKLNLDVQERELPNGRGSVLLVKSLTEGKVASAEAALAMIQQGQDNRKVGATAYNDQSSRSHTLCRFLVESCPAAVGSSSTDAAANGLSSSGSASSGGPGAGATTRTSAWLTLVDLAGSEGAKAALSKDQQAEARDINRSLLTLGKVVFELAKGGQAGHVPFRDSQLTRLLKPSLTGSGAKVAIICNVTPASSQSEETWNTLRFADGAKRIKIAAVKNEALDVAAVVAQYQREVDALKAQLAALTGAAAAGGGVLSPAVLQAMQSSWADSSSANAADRLADQEAQIRHLEESNAMVAAERDQLLTTNRTMMGLLVEQIRGILSSSSGSGSSSGISSSSSTAAAVANISKRRRCLSLESMQYYSLWQAGQDGQQILQDGNAAALTAGSDLRSFGSSGLLRLSSNASTAGRASLRESGTGDADQTVPAVQAVQAVQAPQGEGSMRVGSAVLGSSRSGSQNQLHPLVPGVVPGVVPSVVPVVPCSIYFPGNRRTSKTLAVAVHGGSALPEEGATTAPWLRPIATASVAAAAAAAASCSAVSDAVEVHRKLAAAQQRLDVLVQQLQDKEDLLKEARQMQEGQTLQLRLTITAADRALLRDKLAEAEQQLASYQSVLKEYEAEKEELYDTAYSLYGKVQKLTEQNHAASAELQQLKSRLASGFHAGNGSSIPTGAGATAGAAAAGATQGGSPRRTIPSPTPPAVASGGSNMMFARPKSATAAVGSRSAFAAAAAAAAAAAGVPLADGGSASSTVSPRHGMYSAMVSRCNSISHSSSSPNIAAASAALATLQSAQSASFGSFNQFCINSPFSEEEDAAVIPAAGGRRALAAAAAGGERGSPFASARPSVSGESGGSPRSTVFSSAGGSPTLLSSALQSGVSRIPLPPCLQQRPRQLGPDSMLMKLGVLQHSKLPSLSAPHSGSSSSAASTGGAGSNGGCVFTSSGIPSASSSPVAGGVSILNPGARPPLGAYHGLPSGIPASPRASTNSLQNMRSTMHSRSSSGDFGPTSGSLAGSLGAAAAAAAGAAESSGWSITITPSSGGTKRHELLSVGSPLVAPINRLKSQPGLLAVAAAAVREVGSSDGSGHDVAKLEGPAGAAAATAADLQDLWATLPQTQATAKRSEEHQHVASG